MVLSTSQDRTMEVWAVIAGLEPNWRLENFLLQSVSGRARPRTTRSIISAGARF
jgi:hypothetical protein